MKNKKIIFSLILTLTLAITMSCEESFLDQPPLGSYPYPLLTTKQGIEGMLINAYASLKGPNGGAWYTSPVNWVWGSVTSDEAYKGSEKIDQPDVNPVQRFEVLPSSPIVRDKWNSIYNAIARANQVLKSLPDIEGLSAEDVTRITAEARFLRGLSHLEAVKLFGNVPYVDETELEYKNPNTTPIWDKIEGDFNAAYTSLDEVMPAIGRANKWAAATYLAKTYMFQGKFALAKPLLETIIASGKTSAGVQYGLHDKYQDNFTVASENGKEAIFGMQYSLDATTNGNYEMTLAYPAPIFTGCCGFYQPSQNLVNSFKTENGLPMLDDFNDTDMKNDEGLLSSEPFVEYTGTVDPRLDWTVGRRGIPYHDYGNHPGLSWIRDIGFSGPFSPKKNVFTAAEKSAGLGGAAGWGWNNSAKNFVLIRFADVILWHAECEAEIGTLQNATDDVNDIRLRASNTAGFVKEADGVTPAANYDIELYTLFADKDAALKAIRFERKLELAMEGHRYFDLVRWGIAEEVMDAYLAEEGTKRIDALGGTDFKPRNVRMPIPEDAINRSFKDNAATLVQNEGY